MKKILFTLILVLTACLSHAQTLYSITSAGGIYDSGTICKLDLATNTLTAVFSFDGSNGAKPDGSLLKASNGKLYGLTYQGGSIGDGVIFSYDLSTATYAKLHDFDGTNGGYPIGSLIQASNGKLYGVTSKGGSNDYGVIFSYDPSTATYAKLKSFNGTNGRIPQGSLVQASDGKLYGTTSKGGSSGGGVIFSYDPSSATYATLKNFNGTNGRNPLGSLVQASNGKLYGVTYGGGLFKNGIIFSYNPATATLVQTHDFQGGFGATTSPNGSLIQASDGKLYGMTLMGGSYFGSGGAIFSYGPASSLYADLYNTFQGTNGSSPWGSLMQASNGKLYGMTYEGGSRSELGVSFSFDPVDGTYTKLADFTGSNGSHPYHASFIEVCVPTPWYRDADGDGFGDVNNSITACSSPTPPGYVTKSTDCDDTKLLYADNDGDGFGAGSPVACGVANNTDCNDNKTSVHPGAPEICGNGIDDNCNGQVDEGCSSVLITINNQSIFEGNKGTAPMKFTAILNKNPVITTTVDYTTQNSTAKAGSDYIAQSGTLTFEPGVKTNVITIQIIGDTVPELNETFKVLLSNPVNAGISDDTGIGTILNNDSTTALKPIAQNEDAGSAVLRDITLSPNPASGKVNLILTGYSGNLTIQLLDINGKTLQERKVISLSKLSQQTIDISNYSNGVYLVSVMDEKGNRKTEKLVISR